MKNARWVWLSLSGLCGCGGHADSVPHASGGTMGAGGAEAVAGATGTSAGRAGSGGGPTAGGGSGATPVDGGTAGVGDPVGPGGSAMGGSEAGGLGGAGEPETCGDGTLQPGEACEDHNQRDGDGCSHDCQVEPGWRCLNLPGTCAPIPGNIPCPQASCQIGNACITNAAHVACDCPASPLPACASPVFRSLPLLPEGTRCVGVALNDDATTIVGSCDVRSSTYSVAWRNAAPLPVEKIGLADPDEGIANAVSANGSRAAGGHWGFDASFIYDFGATNKATRLAAGLPTVMSADGLVIAGVSNNADDGFRWTSAGSIVVSRGQYAAVSLAGLSADGAVLVGSVLGDSASRAARWNAAGNLELLPLPSGATSAEAAAVNANGTRIAGTAWFGSDSQAVLWTSNGPQTLGEGASTFATATAISADGTRVLGRDHDGAWVVWDETHGKRSLLTILTDAGFDAAGWSLESAVAISGDGEHVLGTARYSGPEHPNQEIERPFLLRVP